MLTFGRYEALFKIASGGMAEVHAARIRGEAGFEKLVAVKRMLPHLTEDPEFSAMFLDEARLAANVASPNVVSTLDLGRAEDGALYIVMELVVGVALSSLVKAAAKQGRPIPVAIACELIAQAAMGLDDAHEACTPTGVHLGIVHRDVSPQNVLVGGDGRVRVVDFGVARALLRQTHTSTGTMKGKFGYFSPEQASAKDLDRRSDVFSLGIVAWETLLMQRLFEGPSPLDQIALVRDKVIPHPSVLRPDVPAAVSRVVMRALDRDPDKRWPTAAAFASALREAIGSVPAREVAKLVHDVSAAQMREIQLRIDSALAGDGRDTNVLRAGPPPDAEPVEPGLPVHHTPTSMPKELGDLATVIRSVDDLQQAETTTRRGAPRRTWAYGLALSIVLLALVGAAVLAQQSPEAPIAIPLPHVDTTVHVEPPPVVTEPLVPVPAVEAPEAPVEAATEPVEATPHVEVPRVRETITPRADPRTEPPRTETPRTETPRDRRRGLASDDAFDQGI